MDRSFFVGVAYCGTKRVLFQEIKEDFVLNMTFENLFKIIPFFGLIIGFLACESEDSPAPKKQEEEEEDTTEWVIQTSIPGDPIRHIEWVTPVKVSHDVYSAEYPRMLRLGGDTLFLAYHGGSVGNEWDNIYLRKSFDLGATWSDPITMMTDNDPNYWGFSNPEFLELRSGRIMMAFTGRGRPDDNFHGNIQLMLSEDRGETWSSPRIVSMGRAWEPAMIQHPNGDVQLFYSSEARWWQVADFIEQEILMVKSTNGGLSWNQPKTVAYTNGVRDGMPVPLVLNDKKGMVFAIESVGNSNGPWILEADLESRFEVSAAISRRLAVPKSLVNFGGGTYIIQLPTGETILSCHDTGGREIGLDWKKNTMYVLVGDNEAKNFSKVSYPFPDLPADEGAFFNSVHALDENTVIALGSRHFSDNHAEVHWVTGSIIRE
jgi:hypothetical protein